MNRFRHLTFAQKSQTVGVMLVIDLVFAIWIATRANTAGVSDARPYLAAATAVIVVGAVFFGLAWLWAGSLTKHHDQKPLTRSDT